MITDRYLALPISVKAKRDEHNEDSSTPNWQAKGVTDGSDSSAAVLPKLNIEVANLHIKW